ncbi:MAG: hypothetical protein ACRELF_04335, partial [Gemmataceae bacterium]
MRLGLHSTARFGLFFLLAVPSPGAAQPPLLARLGERQPHKDSTVRSLLFAPDGRTLATLDSEGTIRLWDLVGHKQRACWGDAKTPFQCLTYSPDARLLAAVNVRGVHLWEPATGRAVRSLPQNFGSVASVCFSTDARFLAVAERGQLRFFGQSPVHLFELRPSKDVQKIKVRTVDDPLMTFLADSSTVAVWGVRWSFWDAALGADRTHFFTGEDSNETGMVEGNVVFRQRRGPSPENFDICTGSVFSPNGRLLARVYRGDVRLYDLATGRLRCEFWPGHLLRLQFSADSRILLCRKQSVEDMLYLWEVNSGRQVSSFVCLNQPIDAEALGPDGFTLATAMRDGTIELHDIRPREWKRVRRSGLASWELQRCWRMLRSSDGWAADEAAWMLAADAKQSLPLLREQLHRGSTDEEIGRLIEQLDSDSFTLREAATEKLQHLDLAAEPALRRILRERPSLELRRRVKDLLEDIDRHRTPGPAGENLRAVRAIRALERMNTKEARAILEDLARGGAGAWQTQEAREAVQRLKLCS